MDNLNRFAHAFAADAQVERYSQRRKQLKATWDRLAAAYFATEDDSLRRRIRRLTFRIQHHISRMENKIDARGLELREAFVDPEVV